jgi:predicted Zn-dependent peptidase
VLEEIAMRDDDPEDTLGEVFRSALFGDHPLGRASNTGSRPWIGACFFCR